MRWLVRILLIAAALFALGSLGGVLYLRHQVQQKAAARAAALERGFAAWSAAASEDGRWLAGLDVFRPAPGPDAGPFLNPRLPWTGPDAVMARWEEKRPKDVPDLKLEKAVADALARGDWLEAEPALFEKLDFGWMGQLSGFGHWSLEAASPWDAGVAFERIEAPLPTFSHLLAWSKLRLAKGLADGQPAQAGAEVRQLARLCASTETLLGEMVAVALLGQEDEARAKASAGGLPVEGWATLDAASRTRIKRVLWSLPAYTSLEIPAAHEKDFEAFQVGRCAALNEATTLALALRPLLQESRPAAYARIERNLGLARECRLPTLRAAWAAPDEPAKDPLGGGKACTLGEDSAPECKATWMLSGFPGMRRLTGEVLLEVGSPDWFKHYAAGAPK